MGDVKSRETDPSKITYGRITSKELLELAQINGYIAKTTWWMAKQVFSNGIIFDEEQEIEGIKFDKPWTFKTFYRWLRWIGAINEYQKAIAWSLVLSISVVVHFGEDETPTKLDDYDYYGPLPEGTPASAVEAFHEEINGSGFKIWAEDDDGNWETVRIKLRREDTFYVQSNSATTEYLVDISRCVFFINPAMDLTTTGSSAVIPIAHLGRVQQHIIDSVAARIKNLAAGIFAMKVVDEKDRANVEDSIGDKLDHCIKIWLDKNDPTPLDQLFTLFVPDLKSSQLSEISLLIEKNMATAANLSLRVYGEEDQGAGLGQGGAPISLTLVQEQIKSVQETFHTALEESFHLLGLEDTAFEFVPPFTLDKKSDEKTEEVLPDEENLIDDPMGEEIEVEEEEEEEDEDGKEKEEN